MALQRYDGRPKPDQPLPNLIFPSFEFEILPWPLMHDAEKALTGEL
jgi:hypothetical protein